MAKLGDVPPKYIRNAVAKTLVFSNYHGRPYVRTRGTMKPRQRSAAELETVANFVAASRAYKLRDQTTEDALGAMTTSTQKRLIDDFISLQFGHVVTQTGWTYKPATGENNVYTADIRRPDATSTVVLNVNTSSYALMPFSTMFIPFSTVTFNRYVLLVDGNSNQAGQTITMQLVKSSSPTNPASLGGDDLVVTNTFGTFQSAVKTINLPPSSDARWFLAWKGSNATVDLVCAVVQLVMWQAD